MCVCSFSRCLICSLRFVIYFIPGHAPPPPSTPKHQRRFDRIARQPLDVAEALAMEEIYDSEHTWLAADIDRYDLAVCKRLLAAAQNEP